MVYERRVRVGLVLSHKVRDESQLPLEAFHRHLRQAQQGRHVTDAVGLCCVALRAKGVRKYGQNMHGKQPSERPIERVGEQKAEVRNSPG